MNTSFAGVRTILTRCFRIGMFASNCRSSGGERTFDFCNALFKHASHLLPILISLVISAATHGRTVITPAECETLNDYLGPKTPGGCFALGHNDGTDAFSFGTEPGQSPFQGKDATHHRNSWLWPRLARRVTKDSKLHQSRWRQPVEVNEDECRNIFQALKAKLEDGQEALDELPVACKPFVASK